MSYDERFKALLTEFFQNFLELFFPEMAQQIDWSKKPEFLDKELPSVMKASPKAVDLLTKVWSLEPPRSSSPQRLCLIHVEVESRKSRESLGRRVARYVTQIDEKFGLPVVPVAVFIHVGGDGIGWQTWNMTCWNYTIQSTRFPYIGLPALDGVRYSATQNPIAWALSGLMNVPSSERARIKCESERKIEQAKLDLKHKQLLLESVHTFTVLDQEQQRTYEALLRSPQFRKVKEMQKTMFDTARETGAFEGRQEGRLEGERTLLLKLLESKFGTVPERLRNKVSRLDEAKISRLASDVLPVERISELKL